MHGRVKVRTTEEQERSRKEEKEKKLVIFRSATDAIFEKRNSKIMDLETLRLISDVLLKVPDWFTLWNYRREIVSSLKPSRNNKKDTITEEEYTVVLNRELDLTKHCLFENPKSYSTWHHRCWVMLQFAQPDWKKELDLCSSALTLDERNFHCWDYRRFVVTQAGISSSEEFEFTTNKLTTNFSNYSSWHYRSSLLSIMSLDKEGKNNDKGLPETVIREEMNMIHNAVFTDPSDQSAWFYHRWLMSRGPKKTHFREVYINRILERLILVFAKPESITELNSMEVDLKVFSPDSEVIGSLLQKPPKTINADCFSGNEPLKWISALKGEISAVWWLQLPREWLEDENKVVVTIRPDASLDVVFRCQMNSSVSDSLVRVSLNSHRMFNHYIALDSEDILLKELKTVRELYELEPDNKWVLLTMLSLLRFTNPKGTLQESREILQKLASVDPLRTNYYSDLRSRHTIENAVMDVYQKSERSLQLPNSGISRLYCLEWLPLLTIIDLSGNSLKVLPAECAYCVCLVEFHLDDNQLKDLTPLNKLLTLQQLTVRNNCIASFEGLEPVLCCPKLKRLDVTGNAVVKLPGLTERVLSHPQAKMHGQALTILYEKII